MGRSLWDAQRHDEYIRQRDDALDRQSDRREGTSVARDIDVIWPLLAADERQLLEYLLLSGARSCIGNCGDPLLSRLVERGMLSLPPGVRPVLTDDLATLFQMAPALWDALAARRADLLPPERNPAGLLDEAARRFCGRVTLVTPDDATSPDRFAGQGND